jgi:DNA-binding SARP family transcriptional activator/tetratricopeptide (TPR) repeat protein
MEFRILGPLEVVEEGRILQVDRRLSRALLAYLLLHANEPVSAGQLIDELWGEIPPKTALASLRNYVSRLRKTLGPERLRFESTGYVLYVDPEQFDLACFSRLVREARGAPAKQRAALLREALALWRGEPLEDLAFEEFAQAEIAQLAERRLAALESRIDADLELGLGPELLDELESLIHEHPLRERLRGQLMRGLYRAGRQADALQAYQQTRRMLRDELGLEPGEELRTLERRILEHDLPLPSDPSERAPPESRRMVTVLVCDLADSIRLATSLDAEAYRRLTSSHFEVVSRVVEEHGGTIEQSVGDAVMGLFGVPELHEDDALRAVYAAVDVRAAVVSRTHTGEEVRVRIGIETGDVVTSTSGRQRAVGAAVNIAAHLQAHADANEIVLGTTTQQLVQDAVRAAKIDVGEGLIAWRLQAVVAPVPPVARQPVTPLVGRRKELQRLQGVFRRVRDEKLCDVVTVTGEAGIGKTRLAREFLDAVRGEARVLVGRCRSHGAGATYLPITEIVREIAPEGSVPAIAAMLDGTEDAQRVAELVAEVMGSAEGTAAAGEVFWAIRRLLETVAHGQPLVVAFDDLHWAEPTLLDLIEYLGEWARAPILIVSLARQELLETRPGWAGPSSTGFLIELGPLAAPDVSALLEEISGGPVAPDLREQIVDHAGGNPLFAEQLLLLASERADPRVDQAPPTIEGLIAARLAHLDPGELGLLRRASVIGRLFTEAELGALGQPRQADLASLRRRGIVHLMERDAGHRFHHALIRDVAYRSIPRAERVDLHVRVADHLERHDGADELVGYHLEQAFLHRAQLGPLDHTAEAVGRRGAARLFAAGRRARDRGDLPAAQALLARAIDLSPADSAVRLCGQVDLAEVLNTSAEYAHSLSLLEELAAVAEASADTRVAALVTLERIWATNQTERAALENALRAAREATGELEKLDDPDGIARGLLMIAQLHVWDGETAEAERLLDRALGHAERAGRVALVGDVLEWLCWCSLTGPTPTTVGMRRCKMALQSARGSIKTEAAAHVAEGTLRALRRDTNEGRDSVARGRSLNLELGDRIAWAATALMAAEVEMVAGDYIAAEDLLLPACELLRQHGQLAYLATLESLLAQALLAQGRDQDALRLCDDVRRIAAADDRDAHVRADSVCATVTARRGELDPADHLLRRAKAVADPTDSLRLRAFVSLSAAEVGRLSGRSELEQSALREVLHLSTVKGDLATAALARDRLGRTSLGAPIALGRRTHEPAP